MTKTFEQIEAERAAVAARVAARRPKPPEPIVVPAARVPWRKADDAELSQAARQVKKLALDLGWEVIQTYSCGPYIGADGKVLEEDVESVALIFRWGSVRPEAWCMFVRRGGWSYDGGSTFAPRTHLPNAATLKSWLVGEPPPKKKKDAP